MGERDPEGAVGLCEFGAPEPLDWVLGIFRRSPIEQVC